MSTAPATVDGPLLTADGVPLKESLQISLRRSKMRALLLVLPPLLFLFHFHNSQFQRVNGNAQHKTQQQ